jgi:hypothetical protein
MTLTSKVIGAKHPIVVKRLVLDGGGEGNG